MTKPTEHQLNLINDVIEEFNFEKVHIAMTALDWKWAIPPKNYNDSMHLQVPTLVRLKEQALGLLITSIDTGFCSSGGFKAEYFPAKQEEIIEGNVIKQYAEPEYFTLTFELAYTCSWNELDD